jgi:tRNA dimethylallyltransferase
MYGIVIAGPTGVGKTNLSLEIAARTNSEIISADSMQVYKYLDIGTAKIKECETRGIVHHMIDIVEPIHKFSVGEYHRHTGDVISEIKKRDKNIVLAGGTGLYINSVTEGIAKLPESRVDLRDELEKNTLEALNDKLKELDYDEYCAVDRMNKRRVVRSVEICLLSGEKASVLKKNNIKNNNCKFLKFALGRDRDILYDRINKRVDLMMEEGFLQEAEKIYKKYRVGIDEIAAIGYRELFMYFSGEKSLIEVVELIKQNSRKYAKRQFTWFKNDPSYKWIDMDKISEEEAVKIIMSEV